MRGTGGGDDVAARLKVPSVHDLGHYRVHVLYVRGALLYPTGRSLSLSL